MEDYGNMMTVNSVYGKDGLLELTDIYKASHSEGSTFQQWDINRERIQNLDRSLNSAVRGKI